MKTKKTSKLLFLFLVISLYGQNLCSQINFSDSVLKQKLLTANTTTNQIAFDINDNPIAIDINPADGIISSLEAATVYKLNLRYSYGSRISSIEGLQYFTNLKSLDLYNNNISNPNQLYALSATLETLDISFNRYLENQSLQFSGTNLNNLVNLKAFAIGLSSINITGLSNLQELNLSYNRLTSLNLSGCSSLITVNASSNRDPNLSNGGITTLTYNVGDLLNVTNLNLSTNRFSALQLADFPNLQTLHVYENDLTTLDISSLYQLVELSCNNNHIGSINFGTINQLQYLSCSYNNLHNLDVSNQTSLLSLNCHKNYLTNLDISSLSNLTSLICSNNLLTTLDASTNSELSVLICSDNNLTSMILKNNGPFMDGESFGFFNNDNLTYICEDAGQISYINTYLAQYGYTGVTVDSNCGIDPPCDLVAIPDPNFEQALLDQDIDTDGLLNGTICRADAEAIYDALIVSNKNINDLTGIEAFINLKKIDFSWNNVSSVDFSHNVHLKDIVGIVNQLVYINIDNCLNLNFLNLSGNQLTNVNVSNNLFLYSFSLNYNNLQSVNLLNNTLLTYIGVGHNNLSSIDVTQNTDVTIMDLSSNNLNQVDLSQTVNLGTLYCSGNQIINLDLSNNSSLGYLYCDNNLLTTLDLSNNPLIIELLVANNFIEYIDLTYNHNLVRFNCDNNIGLTYLNIKNGNNNIISIFRALNNPDLTCIMVDDPTYSGNQTNWFKDPIASYSTFCPVPPILEPISPIYCSADLRNFTLQWDPISGAEGYQVEVIVGTSTTSQFYNLNASQTSITLKKSSSKTKWRLRPLYQNDGIWSEWGFDCLYFTDPIDPIGPSISFQPKQALDNNTQLTIYPNPSKKGTLLNIDSQDVIKSLKVFNINGQTVYETTEDIREININNLESGIYMVGIETIENTITKKIIIE